LKDLVAARVSDLVGDDSLSAAERTLVRHASMLTLQLEMQKCKFAEQDGVASTDQLRIYLAVNACRRTLEAIGLKREAERSRPIH
jgi:hypothetical protein